MNGKHDYHKINVDNSEELIGRLKKEAMVLVLNILIVTCILSLLCRRQILKTNERTEYHDKKFL